jgi:hypothetical protein
MKKTILLLSTLLFLSAFLLPIISAQDDTQPPTITLIEPTTTTISMTQPNITIEITDDSGIDTRSINVIVDQLFDVIDLQDAEIIGTTIHYQPSEIFKWNNGNHTIDVTVSDVNGNEAKESFVFLVDTSLKQGEAGVGINVFLIVQFIIIGTIIIFLAIGVYILYLKKTKDFTFEKFFAQHPIEKEVFVLYLPIVIAFLFTMLTLAYVMTTPGMSVFALEYVLVIGFFIAVAPFAIDAQMERKKISKYEQAYAQLLFEIADAMRGGLDPTKAIIELSTTDTSILKDNLRAAADNIKLGRPFDHVMKAMAKPIKSDLVKRYAVLIGDTSKIGGEPSLVIHRAAKDMDDFIKVGKERRRQLMSQAMTIYIAFGVLLIVLYQLITMFPSLGSIDVGLLGGASLEDAGKASAIERMSFTTIKQRFFDLLLINSIGTGTIIGSFIDGNIKFGLTHSMILVATSVIFFVVMII